MPAQAALATIATLLSFAPQGNRVDFRLDRGAAELTWAAPGVFRFRRTLEGPLPAIERRPAERIEFEIEDAPGTVRLRSRTIEVAIQKRGLLISVRGCDGAVLMRDISEPRATASGFGWQRFMPDSARYYGLSPRPEPGFDWRGRTDETATPFLYSTAGYGELHLGGRRRFDFTAPDSYSIEGPLVDYFFYAGPRPKDVFEQRNRTRGAEGPAPAMTSETGPPRDAWQALREDLLRLTHAAMSGLLSERFDLARYAQASPEASARARQIGSLAPGAIPGSIELSNFRNQLVSFYASYDIEKRDKGYPVWHPLPFQFPDDPECARRDDEFMLGDEMLIAPIYTADGGREVYLPQGSWTNLETNEVFPGRRTITVRTNSLPVFARNGTIVPLDSAGGAALHYFPSLAAEFFLLEPSTNAWTQVHASPAADIFRFEIEPKAVREYEWVVHHVERPSVVGFEETKFAEVASRGELRDGAWSFDAANKNLHIRVHVDAGARSVIHVSW